MQASKPATLARPLATTTSCLQEEDVKMMARCIALDIDCAQVCTLAAAAMARESEHAKAVCILCATICEACGAECAHHATHGMAWHGMAHCQVCAEACTACVSECRQMASMA